MTHMIRPVQNHIGIFLHEVCGDMPNFHRIWLETVLEFQGSIYFIFTCGGGILVSIVGNFELESFL